MADKIIRNPATLEERTVDENAVPFFVNAEQPWVLLDSAGRVSGSATTAAKKEN